MINKKVNMERDETTFRIRVTKGWTPLFHEIKWASAFTRRHKKAVEKSESFCVNVVISYVEILMQKNQCFRQISLKYRTSSIEGCFSFALLLNCHPYNVIGDRVSKLKSNLHNVQDSLNICTFTRSFDP